MSSQNHAHSLRNLRQYLLQIRIHLDQLGEQYPNQDLFQKVREALASAFLSTAKLTSLFSSVCIEQSN